MTATFLTKEGYQKLADELEFLRTSKQFGAQRRESEKRAAAIVKVAVGMAGGILAISAGISVAAQVGGGLWLLLPAAAIALASAVLNAWRLMVDVAEEDPDTA